MNQVEQKLREELEERVRFEGLMAELFVHFINLPAHQVDGAIEEAQRLFCGTLGLERSSLFQRFDDEPEALLLTHFYQCSEGPLIGRIAEKRAEPKLRSGVYYVPTDTKPPLTYKRLDAKVLFPWICQQLQGGLPIVISCLEDLPEEAAADLKSFRQFGTRSTVVLPLVAGGNWLGCLSFASLQQPRAWSKLQVERFQFLAHAFANALARKRAEEALQTSEERLSLTTESAGTGLWSLQLATNRVWVTPKLRELFQFKPQEELTYEKFSQATHPEDRERVRRAMEQAVQSGKELDIEFRVVSAKGEVSWISARGRRRCGASGKPERLMGASIDITERKLTEEALRKSYDEIKALKDRLQAESEYLKEEIKVSHPHDEIIGRSRAIREVLHLVEQVAPNSSAVLLTGETGTGKELLARAIHWLSPRRDRVMVEVNCAALPEALAESELFGRERGAYTGALTSQVGRFEVADGSSIFLDEVGELSLEVQAKLLRVLQEGQFQRLGDPKSHQVNVRVIAATNHDLAQAVREGRFREDLFYRLNVFPIQVPPLRARPEDIPLLVLAFVAEFSRRMGRPLHEVPQPIMQRLQRHDWPGNIRELRNVIERGVILSAGGTLQLELLRGSEQPTCEPATLAEAEQQHILKILERTNWRIKGPYGAAQLLGLKPGTLYSRMRKLGIPHRREKDRIPTGGQPFLSARQDG